MSSLGFNLILLAIAAVVLVQAATMLVRAISVISAYLKLSEFVISFMLMAFVTSIPEIAVAINAAISNKSELALGTALGSNITDLTLIIAIPTLLAGGIKVESIIARRDSFFMAIYALIPVIMLIDGEISRADGIVLLIFYAIYLYRLLTQSSQFHDHINSVGKKEASKQIGMFIFATVLLFLASRILVSSAENVTAIMNIPILLVGLILVSAGTSLPELAFELRAIKLHKNEQVLGDILGSVVANSTIVIAIAAIISPITVANFDTIATTVGYLVVILLLFLLGISIDKELKVREVLILLMLYFVFLFTELGLEIIHQVRF